MLTPSVSFEIDRSEAAVRIRNFNEPPPTLRACIATCSRAGARDKHTVNVTKRTSGAPNGIMERGRHAPATDCPETPFECCFGKDAGVKCT